MLSSKSQVRQIKDKDISHAQVAKLSSAALGRATGLAEGGVMPSVGVTLDATWLATDVSLDSVHYNQNLVYLTTIFHTII